MQGVMIWGVVVQGSEARALARKEKTTVRCVST